MQQFIALLQRRLKTPTLFAAATTVVLGALTAAAHADTITLQPRAGDPLPGLTPDQLDRFFKGKDAFMHQFNAQEGLGPAFNQTGCSACHIAPVVGGAGGIAVTRYGILSGGTFNPLEEFGGSLLQAGSITQECADEVHSSANHVISRITNSSLGLGLVEAIPDSVLIGNTSNGGSAHMVHSFEDFDPEDENFIPDTRVGRMGWKAQVATVLTFSADATRNEMGISNRFITQAPPPLGDKDLLLWCESLTGPENIAGVANDQALHPNDQPASVFNVDGVEFIDRITDFQRFVSPPPQTPRNGMTGEHIFMDIGCGQCHIPSYTTPNDLALEEALRDKTIKPYSDFLLQNMGQLGDGVAQGDAGITDMRTPNLWGVRDRDPLLHDGRVGGGTLWSRIAEPGGVVAWHAAFFSAARPSGLAFQALNVEDQQLVVSFLDSLGRRDFDGKGGFEDTGDNFVNFFDFLGLLDCYTGPDQTYFPANWASTEFPNSAYQHLINEMDHPCAVYDVNQDGRVDHIDFAGFVEVYDGFEEECDLWLWLSDHVDGGLAGTPTVPVPPECLESCPGDITDSLGDGPDGIVDGFDLVALLGDWGSCPEPCPADITDSLGGGPDGTVDGFDLLALLGNWGSCPEPEPASIIDVERPRVIFALQEGDGSVVNDDGSNPAVTAPNRVNTPTNVRAIQSRQIDSTQRAIDRQ